MSEAVMNPTGGKVRNDAKGLGSYGAPRRSGDRVYLHGGVDLLGTPGQAVLSPITGVVVRRSRPYANEDYDGLIIEGRRMSVQMFYLEWEGTVEVGKRVLMGDPIGVLQDIGQKYGCKPHLHIEVIKCDPMIFIKEG